MKDRNHLFAIKMMITALGVVYGDIGTSPLYTLKEAFSPKYGLQVNAADVFGILSIILWALIWIVSIKYILFVLRADNQGEGGIMALTALTQRAAFSSPKLKRYLLVIGLLGSSLFYGDSIITPAISVLSAMEGLDIAFEGKGLYTLVVPLSFIVLVFLFIIQKFGTSKIGGLFGPIMVLWFLTLACLGIYGILQYPQVLKAFNPWWSFNFFRTHTYMSITIFGAIILALTGAETLYADMGHFGRNPIIHSWFILVFPALVLNYFGQGAIILDNPNWIRNPFYLLAPNFMRLPLLVLSTFSTVIASQAVISGTFSLTMQAIKLGYIPRIFIQHTSYYKKGQIYIASINWALMIGVLVLVLVFQSSSALASAYGLAVTGTMLITTILVSAIIILIWKWSFWKTIPIIISFIIVDSLFVSSNISKMCEGSCFPVIIALFLFIIMHTWKHGRNLLLARLEKISLNNFIIKIKKNYPLRVKGTGIFLTSKTDAIPHSLLHNLLHNKILHNQVILLTVINADTPRVSANERFEVKIYDEGFFRIILHFGFMEDPDIPKSLDLCPMNELFRFNNIDTTYFVSRETIITSSMGILNWREFIFSFLVTNVHGTLQYFNLPTNKVMEIGTQINLVR